MAIGRLISQLRRSIARGHPDLFQEVFGGDPAPVIKRYLDKFAHSTLIELLKDFGNEGRKLYANTDYAGESQEIILFVNGILGHSDLLQEQIDDLSHILHRPIVGVTSAHDSELLDVANTIFGYLSFTHIMNWIIKEELIRQLERNRRVLLLGFGHGAAIGQQALDLLEEEGQVGGDTMHEQVEFVTFGSSAGTPPKGKNGFLKEHFANEHDAVAKRGCLSWPDQDSLDEGACGRFFKASGRYGHMLREHYLLPLTTEPGSYSRIDESSFAKRMVGYLPL